MFKCVWLHWQLNISVGWVKMQIRLNIITNKNIRVASLWITCAPVCSTNKAGKLLKSLILLSKISFFAQRKQEKSSLHCNYLHPHIVSWLVIHNVIHTVCVQSSHILVAESQGYVFYNLHTRTPVYLKWLFHDLFKIFIYFQSKY